MTSDEKLVAISSGDSDDWNCEHLVVPRILNLAKANEEYCEWYRAWSVKDWQTREKYLTFTAWLIRGKDGREPTNDELEYFRED